MKSYVSTTSQISLLKMPSLEVPKEIEGAIEEAKSKAKDFLLKISVDLVQKVNTKLLPV